MEYIDENEMFKNGNIIIDDYKTIIDDYMKENYNQNGKLKLTYVEYVVLDNGNLEYDYEKDEYISKQNKKRIKKAIFLYVREGINYANIPLIIDGIVNVGDVNSLVKNLLPQGVELLDINFVSDIIKKQGFSEVNFDFDIDFEWGYDPVYCKVYGKPIINTKNDVNVTDAEIQNDILKESTVSEILIDFENFPQTVVDNETQKLLDYLIVNGKLKSRMIKYSVNLVSNSILTDNYVEYSYGNRKFIMQPKNEEHVWVEVKSNKYINGFHLSNTKGLKIEKYK